MADFPDDRVTADRPPISFFGIDCFRQFLVKRGKMHREKVWSHVYLSYIKSSSS